MSTRLKKHFSCGELSWKIEVYLGWLTLPMLSVLRAVVFIVGPSGGVDLLQPSQETPLTISVLTNLSNNCINVCLLWPNSSSGGKCNDRLSNLSYLNTDCNTKIKKNFLILNKIWHNIENKIWKITYCTTFKEILCTDNNKKIYRTTKSSSQEN